jgi:hypothetical protein
MKIFKPNVVLLLCAVIGSIFSYFTINEFIIQISILEYLVIELLISFMHSLYNYVKEDLKLKTK